MEFNKQEMLKKHAMWLQDPFKGEKANLQGADLQEADLQEADLRGANLRGADLQEADLQGADLQEADLQRANLRGADLRGADLRGADLQEADLRGADLRGANLDFSCLPLWCGSKGMVVDKRIYTQLLAHLCALEVDDEDCQQNKKNNLSLARTSHRAKDLLDK